MTNFNKEATLDKEMEQNRKYKGLVEEMYSISSQASTLREQMKKLIKEFDECCPTENKAVKQMLEICQEEAREKLNPHFLIQFYGDRYDLLKVGYQLPEDVRYCCEDVNDHYDLRMATLDGEGEGHTLELDIEVDADFIITAIRANWF